MNMQKITFAYNSQKSQCLIVHLNKNESRTQVQKCVYFGCRKKDIFGLFIIIITI